MPLGISWGQRRHPVLIGRDRNHAVSPDGGKPEPLVDMNKTEDFAYGPQLLPDGDTLLFTLVKRTDAAIDSWSDAQVVVQSLETGERKLLMEGGLDARYVSTGHIVYASGGTLFARPFDLSRLAVTGGAVAVVGGGTARIRIASHVVRVLPVRLARLRARRGGVRAAGFLVLFDCTGADGRE